jgi:hypothetical protein
MIKALCKKGRIMKIQGYVGICGACFEPIKEGDEITFRESGQHFHRNCAETKPNSYYLALERIRGQFEQGENPTGLMNNMERIFKIHCLNNPQFNEDKEDVIKLYLEISQSNNDLDKEMW